MDFQFGGEPEPKKHMFCNNKISLYGQVHPLRSRQKNLSEYSLASLDLSQDFMIKKELLSTSGSSI